MPCRDTAFGSPASARPPCPDTPKPSTLFPLSLVRKFRPQSSRAKNHKPRYATAPDDRGPWWIPWRVLQVGSALGVELLGVVAQVILDKGRDEEVAVVVAGLATQDQRVIALGTDRLEPLWTQLLIEEVIGVALVDEQRLT